MMEVTEIVETPDEIHAGHDEKVEVFLAQVRKHLEQTRAVELLLDMWCEAMGVW